MYPRHVMLQPQEGNYEWGGCGIVDEGCGLWNVGNGGDVVGGYG